MSTPNYIFQGKGHRQPDNVILQQQRARLQRQAAKTTPPTQPKTAEPPKAADLIPAFHLPHVAPAVKQLKKAPAQPQQKESPLSTFGQWLVSLPVVKTVVKFFVKGSDAN